MTNHILGPWCVVSAGNSITDAIEIRASIDGRQIAGIWKQYPDLQHHAIAALVAAAPEMLGALKECLNAEMERRKKLLPNAPATTYCDARIARIRAAIEKAEGRDGG